MQRTVCRYTHILCGKVLKLKKIKTEIIQYALKFPPLQVRAYSYAFNKPGAEDGCPEDPVHQTKIPALNVSFKMYRGIWQRVIKSNGPMRE